MAPPSDGQVPATVTALRRPPVRQSVLVRSDQRHTFDTFVDTIGIWWPVTPFSAGKDQVRDVTFERRQGGRVLSIWKFSRPAILTKEFRSAECSQPQPRSKVMAGAAMMV